MKANNKYSLIMLASSALGMLTNFLASFILDKEVFAWYSIFFSQCSLICAICSFGFSGYYLGHISEYSNNRDGSFLFPLIAAGMLSFLLSQNKVFYESLAFITISVAFTLSACIVVNSQIEKKQIQLAVFQSAPTLLKSLITTLVLMVFFYLRADAIHSFVGFSLFFGFFLFVAFLYFSVFKLNVQYLRMVRIDFIRDSDFYASWIGVVGMFAFAMATPTLVAWKTSISNVAYFGVYLIFWSFSSALTTALVTSRYSFQIAHSLKDADFLSVSRLMKASAKFTVAIVVLICPLLLVIATFLSQRIWPTYENIQDFLFVATVLLIIKTVQPLAGLLLAFPGGIKIRTGINFIGFSILLLMLWVSEQLSLFEILYLFIVVDLLVLVLTSYFSVRLLKSIGRLRC